MKKQILGSQTKMSGGGAAAGVLPWWAVLVLARNPDTAKSLISYRHYHHCTDCGCVMICQYKDCKGPEMRCPECHERLRVSRNESNTKTTRKGI